MLLCFSASHKSASVSLLDSLAVRDEANFVGTLFSEASVKECVLLQTCNRVEIYCVVSTGTNKDESVKQVLRIWSANSRVSFDIVDRLTQKYEERAVIGHVFALASGLESMIIGEDQVLGQLHKAFLKSKERGTSGMMLDKIFMKAIKVGRRVRAETKINKGAVSISSASVELAEKELGDLKEKKILIVGSGEAALLAAEALVASGGAKITVSSRTLENSQALARKINGIVFPYDEVLAAIPLFDLVIVAVSVEEPMITKSRLIPFVHEHVSQTLLIDISSPRAVDPDLSSLSGFVLKNIDDLRCVVDQNIRNRQFEAEKCKALILEELDRFELMLLSGSAQPLIDDIYRRFEAIRQKELKRVISKIGEFDQAKLELIDRFSRELVERIAQAPLSQLREAALNGNSELISAAEHLFLPEGNGEKSLNSPAIRGH